MQVARGPDFEKHWPRDLSGFPDSGSRAPLILPRGPRLQPTSHRAPQPKRKGRGWEVGSGSRCPGARGNSRAAAGAGWGRTGQGLPGSHSLTGS